MAAPYAPTAASRFYSSPPNGAHGISATYIWDVNAVISGAGQGPMFTGCLRLLTPADLGVAATVAPTTSSIVGTGQVIIPATAKSWRVNVITGAAWVDGVGPLPNGTLMQGGGYNSVTTLTRSIAVGGTGTVAVPATNPFVVVYYEV